MKKEKRESFVMIEQKIMKLGLTPHEFVVYAHLREHRNNVTKAAFPSHRTIAKEGCMSVASVKRAITSLINRGLITTNRLMPGGTLDYRVYTGAEIAWDNHSDSPRGILKGETLMVQFDPADVKKDHHEAAQSDLPIAHTELPIAHTELPIAHTELPHSSHRATNYMKETRLFELNEVNQGGAPEILKPEQAKAKTDSRGLCSSELENSPRAEISASDLWDRWRRIYQISKRVPYCGPRSDAGAFQRMVGQWGTENVLMAMRGLFSRQNKYLYNRFCTLTGLESHFDECLPLGVGERDPVGRVSYDPEPDDSAPSDPDLTEAPRKRNLTEAPRKRRICVDKDGNPIKF
jgi:hypothetical protein